MRNKAGMKFDCIFEETLDFIDIDYTHLNKTIRYEQRPHGEWILTYPYQDKHMVHRECSMCGDAKYIDDTDYFVTDNFCPNCGADMRTQNDRSWDTSERGVSGSVKNSIAQKEGDEK